MTVAPNTAPDGSLSTEHRNSDSVCLGMADHTVQTSAGHALLHEPPPSPIRSQLMAMQCIRCIYVQQWNR